MDWNPYGRIEWGWCPGNARVFSDADLAGWVRRRWRAHPSVLANISAEKAAVESFRQEFRTCAEAAGSF